MTRASYISGVAACLASDASGSRCGVESGVFVCQTGRSNFVTRVILAGYRGLTTATNEPLLKRRRGRTLVTDENKSKERDMADFLRKTGAFGVVVRVAEYAVMVFVAVMTGVNTLRLLGILP
jgi:hypothetical protein